MNNYNDFEVNDWLEDTGFKNWVYKGESDHFWKNFISNTPSQFENIERAKNILLSVRGELDSISEHEVKSRISELMNSISDEDKKDHNPWWTGKWLQVAAVVLLAAGLGGYFWTNFFPARQPYYAMLKKLNTASMTEIVNSDKDMMLVNLPDGSSVILKKNTRISFPKEFAPDKREVLLLGEAFFEVQKNPEQPFYIYSGEMKTRVTGTSFSIKANEKDENVSLVVKSGVVEVSVLDVNTNYNTDSKNEKTVLTPNQLVILNRKDLTMKSKKVLRPVLIDLPIESQDFYFKRTPLTDAFHVLESVYGIKINFDKEITKGCTITAKLGDEPVFEKLEMMCAVVNARYESRDGIITVFSDGCK